MSSDITTPIIQQDAPPSYVESQRQHGVTRNSITNQPTSSNIPPPYSPPTYILQSSGPGYQRFDIIDGPVSLVSLESLTKEPCQVVCPNCKRQVVTVTQPTPGALTCLMASLCCFVFLPCVILPFCLSDLQDVAHSCPVCLAYIGTFTRI